LKTRESLERTKIWSWVPTGHLTKNDFAGGDKQQFTGMDCTNVCGIGYGEVMHRKYKMGKLGGDEAHDRSVDCSFRVVKRLYRPMTEVRSF
jgi:hypothetical protein